MTELPATFRPMLSAKIEDYPIKAARTVGGIDFGRDPHDEVYNALRQMYQDGLFPLHCSPKLDGIRTLVHPTLGPVTRTMNEIPNRYIYYMLKDSPELHGLDGEIVVGDIVHPQVFNHTQSTVMTHSPVGTVTPFTFVVFDVFTLFEDPFPVRQIWADKAVRQWCLNKNGHQFSNDHPGMKILTVPFIIATTPDEVLAYEDRCIEEGYEGIMLRSNSDKAPGSRGYKFNRSTAKQALLMKVKRMEDAEGEIVGAEELVSNQNEALKDAFGLTERSSHKANMIPQNTLGVMKVKVTTGKFKDAIVGLGTGFDQATRKKLWEDYKLDLAWLWHSGSPVGKFLGKTVSFKYQPHGSKDAPRIPVFKGFRND